MATTPLPTRRARRSAAATSTTTMLIGYCRVSTGAQARDGISLDEQRQRITKYSEAHGYELAGFEVDAGASGKSLARSALQRVLRRLGDGEAAGVVAVTLDRISRSIRDVIDLVGRAEREGWSLHSIGERLDTSSAVGRFTVHLLGALSQLEREQIGERTRAALGELRRQGKRISGKPPLGYRFERGRLVEVPGEQAVARRIVALAGEGLGAKAMATALNAEGVWNPRTGRPWFSGTLHGVAQRLVATRARA